MGNDMLRPSQAAARFGVSTKTLERWAASGLIGRSKVGGIVFYPARDIADVVASKTTRRTVIPMTAVPAPMPEPSVVVGDEVAAFWAGTVAERHFGGPR
jgi:hypothetical protein